VLVAQPSAIWEHPYTDAVQTNGGGWHLVLPLFTEAQSPSDLSAEVIVDPDAVAWFRDDAGEPVAKMWNIVALLREHGVDVRVLRSANPGRVVYEDRVQVLVDEWNRL